MPLLTLYPTQATAAEHGGKQQKTDLHAANAERYNAISVKNHEGKTDKEKRDDRIKGVAKTLKDYHNTMKREMINRFARGAAYVLDVASGQGGDLHKWVDAGVLNVTGLDVAKSEVEEATRRYNEMSAQGKTWSYKRKQIGGLSATETLKAEYHHVTTVWPRAHMATSVSSLPQLPPLKVPFQRHGETFCCCCCCWWWWWW